MPYKSRERRVERLATAAIRQRREEYARAAQQLIDEKPAITTGVADDAKELLGSKNLVVRSYAHLALKAFESGDDSEGKRYLGKAAEEMQRELREFIRA